MTIGQYNSTVRSCTHAYSAAVDLKNAPGAVYRGEPKGEKAGCTLTLSDKDFIGLVNGELKAQQVLWAFNMRTSIL